MKKQLLINEISLMIATIFFIISTFTKNIYIMMLGFVMIGYSSSRIKKVKGANK
ncbi:hypothetical protein [Clostridium sporogenes]